MKKEIKMKKVLFPILAVVLALSLALPIAAAPAMAAPTTDLYYSGNSDFGTETVAVSTSFVDYGLSGVTYGTAGSVVNCWAHPAWASVKATYTQLVPANWVSSSTLVEDPVGDSWRQFVSTFEIPTGATSLSAVLEGTADNSYEVLLNGTPIGSEGVVYGFATNLGTDYWSAIESWSGATIDGALQTGTNTLTVVVRNWAQTSGTTGSNPTGLIYKLAVTYEEFVAEPSLSIDKEADVEEAYEGDTINYTYLVENTGNVPLDNLAVTDSLGITVTEVDEAPADGYNDGDTNTDGVFDPGEIWEFEAEYTVPWFTAGPVDNTGTANADYDSAPVGPVTDDESVSILHDPAIEITKEGPEEGYFESIDAEYSYTVENTGDCAIEVVVTDDMIGEVGRIDGGAYLIPGATDTFYASNLLECDGTTLDKFVNVATAEATDAVGGNAYDQDCWTVILFQWQPRTIGYWGNWDNHYNSTEFGALFDAADAASGNVGEYLPYYDTYGEVNGFLLGKPPKLSGTDKAMFLMEKQFLAAWLNVKAYWDWTGEITLNDFPASADVGMDPNATVYLTGEAEVALFGSTPTVMDILDEIEDHKADWTEPDNFKTAQIVLDKLNNAENNGYGKFVDRTHLSCAFLYPVGGGTSDNVLSAEPSQGCVVIFDDPTGEVAIEIDGNAHGLIADHEYSVWVRDLTGYTGASYDSAPSIGYYLLDYFTTDGDGMGFFELNIDSADLPDGTYNIQVAINDPSVEPPYTTIIATVKYTSVTVG